METKKHIQAQKKLNGAVQTFVSASQEVDKAVELIDLSITDDKNRMESYEKQITSLYKSIDEVQSNVMKKQAERKEYIELKDKLKQFTLGGK